MSDVTVRQLAEVLRVPVDTLLKQLKDAGIPVGASEARISNSEKSRLLEFLRKSHGKSAEGPSTAGSQITLKRRTVSEIKVATPAGRGSKTVNVEVRGRKTYADRPPPAMPTRAQLEAEREDALRKLRESEAERAAKERTLRAAEDARKADAEAKRKAEETARLEQEEAERQRQAREEAERLEAERLALVAQETAHRAAPIEAELDAEAALEPVLPKSIATAPTREKQRPPVEARGNDRAGEARGTRYGRSELHVTADRAGGRKPGSSTPAARGKPDPRHGRDAQRNQHGFSRPTAPVVREVALPDSISVGDLAQRLSLKVGEIIKSLMKMGVMATVNQLLDQDTAILVVEELGHKAVAEQRKSVDDQIAELIDREGSGTARPPVVTIMGHVDHGKTSLLDHIRRTRVAAGEAGGITQHIGAYHVQTSRGVISFLDTPGHAAFTSMRARGAQLTDIVVLVVAADDGVMPQTVEAINHARAAKVPLIVAMNKMDKPDANPDNLRQGLAKYEVIPEEWGGDTQFVGVSALTGMGIDQLLDAILVQSEVLELTAVRDARATGTVIESSLDKGRGAVATLLIQNGTLKRGDMLICGSEWGRVRAMFDEAGRAIAEAGPSIPCQVLGLSGTPNAGDRFTVVEDERQARDLAERRQAELRESRLVKQQASKSENLFQNMGQGEQKAVNLLIKADVQGSVEALRDALTKLSTDEIKVNVIASGVGGITESDAVLAQASSALLIGFNVRADAQARRICQESGQQISYHSIIYNAIDEVRSALEGKLGTETKDRIIGLAEVKEVFRSSRMGQIAGCLVVDGVVRRSAPIRVLRENVVIFEGELESLRRFKDDASEVRAGTECGIGVKLYNDVRAGDQIECFERVEIQRTL